MSNKQIRRVKALREIVEIRGRLQTLKEQMEPMPYALAEDLNISLHRLRIFEDQTRRHYRHDEELP